MELFIQTLLTETRICLITIFRIVFTFFLIQYPHDSTYWIAINAIFLTLEPNLGIVNASLLLLKPLLHRLRPKLGWASNNQSNQDYPLSNPIRDRQSKLLPVKYHARHTDGSHSFTRLKDNNQRLTVPVESVSEESTNGRHFSNESSKTRVFSRQRDEGDVGKVLSSNGITVTKTVKIDSQSNL